jgi:hypothetical protein
MTKEMEMRKFYDAFLSFDGTRKAFCEANHINLYTFIYWQEKFSAKKKRKSGFVSVENVSLPATVPLDSMVEIEYPNGVKLKTTTEITILRQLIQLV